MHQLQISVGHVALLDDVISAASSIRNSTTDISGKGYPCSMNCTKVMRLECAPCTSFAAMLSRTVGMLAR